jgi:hypothetical protein
MPQRLYLHVGTPKSGTTYLQRVLWQNRDALRSAGVLLPARFNTHYAAAKQITGREGVGKRLRRGGSSPWPTLVARAGKWPGNTVISHELFAPATREQTDSALALLGDVEVHLIVTVRGLHRLLPSAWQEQVKSGHSEDLVSFLQQVSTRSGPRGSWFWTVQDVTDVINRWGGDRPPPERVHVVTCPPDRRDPDLLWHRFASVIGVHDGDYDLKVTYAKTSMGVVETELLRRVQAARDSRFQDSERHLWIRRLYARLLEERDGDPILIPPENQAWVEDCVDALGQSLARHGFHLVHPQAPGGARPATARRVVPGRRTRGRRARHPRAARAHPGCRDGGISTRIGAARGHSRGAARAGGAAATLTATIGWMGGLPNQ